MAEGAPLLRAYRLIPIEGSNPSLSANASLFLWISFKSTYCPAWFSRVSSSVVAMQREESWLSSSCPTARWVVCCPWLLPVALLMASRFGLVTLIAKGYGILTCGFIAVFVVPVLTIGIYRIITLGKSKQMGN